MRSSVEPESRGIRLSDKRRFEGDITLGRSSFFLAESSSGLVLGLKEPTENRLGWLPRWHKS